MAGKNVYKKPDELVDPSHVTDSTEDPDTSPDEAGNRMQAPTDTRKDPWAGTTPVVLHVSGTFWANNERKLIRCAPTGDLADCWIVQVGDQYLFSDARTTLPATKPYHQLSEKLQTRVRWGSLEKAAKAARDYQVAR